MIAASWSESELAFITLAAWLIAAPFVVVAGLRARSLRARLLLYVLAALGTGIETSLFHGDLAGTSPWLLGAFAWVSLMSGAVACWRVPNRRLFSDVLHAALGGAILARLGWVWGTTEFAPLLLFAYSSVFLGPHAVLAVMGLWKPTHSRRRPPLSHSRFAALGASAAAFLCIVCLRAFDEGPPRAVDEVRDPVVYVAAEVEGTEPVATRITLYWRTRDDQPCRPLSSAWEVSLDGTTAHLLDRGRPRWAAGRFGLPVRVCRARATFVVAALPNSGPGRLTWSDGHTRWSMPIGEEPLPLSCEPDSGATRDENEVVAFSCSRYP